MHALACEELDPPDRTGGERERERERARRRRSEREGDIPGRNNTAMGTSSALANDNETMPSMAVYPDFMAHPAARRAS